MGRRDFTSFHGFGFAGLYPAHNRSGFGLFAIQYQFAIQYVNSERGSFPRLTRTGRKTILLKRIAGTEQVGHDMDTVGNRIRARRIELGWTQDELAVKASISKGFLSDLENAKRSVSADKLRDISQALGVSMDYLMEGKAAEPPKAEISIPAALSEFAEQEGLSYRRTLALLQMQRQIVAHRRGPGTPSATNFDWRKLYESVKDFLE